MPGEFYQKGKAEKVDIKGILDRLDSAVFGLAILKALANAIEGKLNDPGFGLAALLAEINASEAKIDILDAVADAIKARTDYLPDVPLIGIFGARYLTISLAEDIVSLLAFALLGSGLCYRGTVTGVPGANQFTCPNLAGHGNNKFANIATPPYYAYVMWDDAGLAGAPQGEMQPITNYWNGPGTFQTTPFTVPIGVNDEVLIIHPRMAEIAAVKAQTDKLAGISPTLGSRTQDWQTGEADVWSLGANNVSFKLHSLLLSIHNLVGTQITVRLYMQVAGTERKVYEQAFNATTDPTGLWIVNGTISIHEVLRVTLQSNNAADNAKVVDFDYMMEAM